MKAIKIEATGDAVLIDTGLGFNVWMDIHKDDSGEIQAHWNKYIFFLNNPEDVRIRDFQEDTDNYIECSELAIEYYERHQDGTRTN